jgi:purine-binding chemotaxis protein CheW
MAILLFDVGPLVCALRHDEVSEIVALPALERPPASPDALAGILNLGGIAVPVLRLDRLFDLPPAPAGPYQAVIVLRGSDLLAVLADRATDVVTVGEAQVLPLAAGETYNGCVVAELALDPSAQERGTAQLLSARRIADERERRAVADYRAMQRRRLDGLTGAAPAAP